MGLISRRLKDHFQIFIAVNLVVVDEIHLVTLLTLYSGKSTVKSDHGSLSVGLFQIVDLTMGAPRTRELVRSYAKLLDADLKSSDLAGEGRSADTGWAQVRTTSEFGLISLSLE